MFLTVINPVMVRDVTNGTDFRSAKSRTLPAGRYEVVRVPNPYPQYDAPWLILKSADGSVIGLAEIRWRQLADRRDHAHHDVVIEETEAEKYNFHRS